MTDTNYQLPGHVQIREPLLKFHPQRQDDVDDHPLRGLTRFGPFSRGVLGGVMDPIRIGLIGPPESKEKIKGLLGELEQWQGPTERRAYLVNFNGFSSTFGVRIVRADKPEIILPSSLDDSIARSSSPHLVLAEQLARAVNAAQSVRTEFDVLVVYLPERWHRSFRGLPGEDFDLHDFIKSHSASAGIPTQVIREDRVFTYRDRCSVMWRLGIALYSKAGGIPWKLAHMETDTLYVGLGYAIQRDDKGNPTFLTTCSQVFDHDGTSLEFIAYETRDMIVEQRDNPYLTRRDMHRVMARSLDLYHHRHGGRGPTSVVVHKLNPFKADEVDGCFDAFRSVESIELVQIQKDSLWRGAHLDPPGASSHSQGRGKKYEAGYACLRGSCMLLGGDEALLWTQGNVPQHGGKNFFKEMKGTPKPLTIKRFAGLGPLSQTCRAILALTKMDWNNDALYDRLPVTLSFASRLAQTLKRMPNLTSKPYPFRLFI